MRALTKAHVLAPLQWLRIVAPSSCSELHAVTRVGREGRELAGKFVTQSALLAHHMPE